MKICSGCGSQNKDDAIYCKDCGEKLDQVIQENKQKPKNIKKVNTKSRETLCFLNQLFGFSVFLYSSCTLIAIFSASSLDTFNCFCISFINSSKSISFKPASYIF